MMKMVTLLLCFVIVLTGCEHTSIVNQETYNKALPDELKTCKEIPQPPQDVKTQRAVRDYITNLLTASLDCKHKHKAVVEYYSD